MRAGVVVGPAPLPKQRFQLAGWDVPKIFFEGAEEALNPTILTRRVRRDRMRRAEEPGPFHNFPESLNSDIFAGTRTEVNPTYVLYSKPVTMNLPGTPIYGPGSVRIGGEAVRPIIGYTPSRSIEGVYEIGVRPSASGRTEVITQVFQTK